MSVKIMSRVWDCPYLAGGDLLIMLALADFANDDGYAWPSVETLSNKARLSVRRTQQIIQCLEFRNFLLIEKNKGPSGVNLYRVITVDQKRVRELTRVIESGGSFSDFERGEIIAGGGEAGCTGGVKPTSPRTVIEPSVPSKEGTLKEFSQKLKTPRMMSAWQRWMTHRRAFKKPKSWVTLFNDQIEFLERYDEPTAWGILDASLRNGYQGLFPPKEKVNGSAPVQKSWAARQADRMYKEEFGCNT